MTGEYLHSTPQAQAVKSRHHLGVCEQERTAFLRTAKLPGPKGQVAAIDVAIDDLAYALYGLTEQETANLRGCH
jgi:hypothetical protein